MSSYLRVLAGVLVALFGANSLRGANISSFSPPLGSPGEQVTILGSGFYPGTLVVRFNGVQDTSAQAVAQDGTSILAKVPAGATSGPISVSVNGSDPALSSQDFTVIGPGPYVTNFSPYAGSATTLVSIDGVHFTGATNAYFGGLAGSMFFVQSDSRIQMNAPTGVTNGPISVKSPKGTFVSSNFFVTPVLTGFSPASGRANTNVTFTGKNLLGATGASINGMPLILGPATNNTTLRATLPTGISTGPVRIDTPAGPTISTSNFIVLPTIFGFSPGAGSVGSSVTLTGADFNVGTPTVRFNGVASTNVTGVSFGQLTAVVPSGATSGLISITTSAGSHTNSAIFFVTPVITSFSPTNSAPGTTVTITGQNLLGTTDVSFNGASANFTVPTNNTTLQAIVPANVTTGPITVTTPAGTAVSSRFFYAVPIVTGFTPTHGLPGTNVTITGSNFLGVTSVKFDGFTASFTAPTTNTIIQAVVPANAQSGVITVTGPAGTGTSADVFLLDSSDLSLSLTAVPNPVFVGSNLTYTLLVTNLGPFTAPNVVLSNTLPSSVTLKSVSVSQGTLITNGNQIVAILGSINVGALVTANIVGVPQSPGNITNVASIRSGYPDPAATNNLASIITTVLPLPILSVHLLSSTTVRLSWPVALTNYSLEFRTNLFTGLAWSSLNAIPTISSNENVVLQTSTASSTFYRLKK